MSFPFLPIYTGDYLRDTRHLSPAEHGCYLLLLMHSWDTAGVLPPDERKLAGIVNARSPEDLAALRTVLADFWTLVHEEADGDGAGGLQAAGYANPRLQVEIERANSISGKRAGAAHKRWDARATIRRIKDSNTDAKQAHSTSNANAMPKDLHPPPPPPPPPHKTNTSLTEIGLLPPSQLPQAEAGPIQAKRGSRFDLSDLPAPWRAFCAQARPDLDPDETFAAFGDYWRAVPGKGGVKLDWAATWRNSVRTQRPPPKRTNGSAEPEWRAAKRARHEAYTRAQAAPTTIQTAIEIEEK